MEKPKTGFMGDISDTQLLVLREVRRHVDETGLGSEPRWTDWNLLRFCRARKFDLKKIIDMIDNYIKWFYGQYKHVGGIDIAKYEPLRRFYHHGYCNTDKFGLPVYIQCAGNTNAKAIFENYNDQELTEYWIQSYERLIHVMFPECSRVAGKRIEQNCSILDLKDASLFSMFTGKVKAFTDLTIKIGQDFYPEIMAKMFIINAGFLFAGIYKLVKPMIDVKTQEKITIISGSGKKELLERIEASKLPRSLGGEWDAPLSEDNGPWMEEVKRSRANKVLFHSDQALVMKYFPNILAQQPDASKTGSQKGIENTFTKEGSSSKNL